MKVQAGHMVPLGYGKYFRSDRIVGLEPIEEGRGPGRRTLVYVEGQVQPLIASRSEGAILRDMTEMPREALLASEQRQLLADILDTIGGVEPIIRTFIREQGHWDLNRLEERIEELLEPEDR
jgi:hypothetical protein